MTSSFSLADAMARRSDNLLPLRHLAAWLVIYGHSYPLGNNALDEMDVVHVWLPGFSVSRCAVFLFFAISGYLVTSSLMHHPGVLRYAWHRVLRIYPAYLVCLLLCVLVLGAVFTQWPLDAYFRSPDTWEHLRHNLIPTSFLWYLPGVFEANPYPGVVNGSLWSLGLEVRWYFWLGVLAVLGLVARRAAFTVVVVAYLVYTVWQMAQGIPDPLGYRALAQTFLIGALAAQWAHVLRPSHAWLLAALALITLARAGDWIALAMPLVTVLFTLWVAYRIPAMRWSRDRDYSYGIFLYGFPVQQAVMAIWPQMSPLVMCAVSTLAVLPFAVASWHWVERPVLRWKCGAYSPVPAWTRS
ncbi:acyltransferase [Xanthomonadaceae bacterium JHOS43]|nr:acyltransferase [Xanthomonadaceae bacterium JHOS43]